MLKQYKVIYDTPFANRGDIVYPCIKPDYGCANDDSRIKGEKYMSVTYSPEGAYPFFTISVFALKELVH